MNCACCRSEDINDLDNAFGVKQARRDSARYFKKGLDKRTRKLISHLVSHSDPVASILDIGCGAGNNSLKLLERPRLLVATKLDAVTGPERVEAVRAAGERRGLDVLEISAVAGQGLDGLTSRVGRLVEGQRALREPAGD